MFIVQQQQYATNDQKKQMLSDTVQKMIEDQFPNDVNEILRSVKAVQSGDTLRDARFERAEKLAEEKEEDVVEGFWKEKITYKNPLKPFFFDYDDVLKYSTTPVIEKDDIQALLDLPMNHSEEYLLVDCRSTTRRNDFVIPGSVNIPLGELSRGALKIEDDEFFMRYNSFKPSFYATVICFSDDAHDAEIASFIFNMEGFAQYEKNNLFTNYY